MRRPLPVLCTLAIVTWALCGARAAAEVRLAPVFSDNMVLQRRIAIPIWGTADPGEAIVIELRHQRRKTLADNKGHWRVEFSPLEAASEPIRFQAQGKNTLQLRNVVVGEVWVCAGQSNMEWPLAKSASGVDASHNSQHPNLRLLHLRGAARGGSDGYTRDQIARLTPKRFCTGTWKRSTPDAAGTFSAVAYFFGRRLGQELDVPVGLISPAIGGTPIEAWIRCAAIANEPGVEDLVTGSWLENEGLGKWCRDRARLNLRRALTENDSIPGDHLGPNHSFKPGFMWQAGIEPLIPFPIRGVIWYQGESNAATLDRVKQHPKLFQLLVDDWRDQWGIGDFPFYYVQLPALGRPHWPEFREGQRRLLEPLRNVGMAVTMDVGHASNVHPLQKQPVGERLAHLALANTYGKPVVASGPLLKRVERRGTAMVIHFNHAESGLATTDGQSPRHFELAGADSVFHPADAKIERSTIIVESSKVDKPRRVRYAWLPFPEPAVNLTNAEGLPASPFRFENEPIKWSRLPNLPDKFGFGGPLAGTHNGALIVAGGANFPQGPPWAKGERPAGAKAWHDRIFVLESPKADWRLAEARLPAPLAYAPCVSTSEGIYVLGGETYGTIPGGTPKREAKSNYAVADVLRIEWNADTRRVKIVANALPALPKSVSYHAAIRIGSTIYVAAAQAKNASSRQLDQALFWALDLSKPTKLRRWRSLPVWPGKSRHKMSLAVQTAPDEDGQTRPFIYMLSGSTWFNNADGKPNLARFEFYTDNYRFDPKQETWKRIADLPSLVERRKLDLANYGFDQKTNSWKRDHSSAPGSTDDIKFFDKRPRPAAAATAIGVGDRTVLLFSGATGRFVTMDVEDRPQFPQEVLAYDTHENRWRVVSRMPQAVVTTAVVRWNDGIVFPSGEIRPGVRTRKVQIADASALFAE